jgi:hypothetical protein
VITVENVRASNVVSLSRAPHLYCVGLMLGDLFILTKDALQCVAHDERCSYSALMLHCIEFIALQNQCCQVAAVTDTFLKCGSF